MRFLEKIGIKKKQPSQIEAANIYKELGIAEPFTALAGSQFRNFIGELSECPNFNEIQKKPFESLWNAACIDMDGFGNNIWHLKDGKFTIYQDEDATVMYEKVSEGIDKKTDQGRANFTYHSKENGDLIIAQNERNREVFLVYISNVSDRLRGILKDVECKVLDIRKNLSKTEDFRLQLQGQSQTEINEQNVDKVEPHEEIDLEIGE